MVYGLRQMVTARRHRVEPEIMVTTGLCFSLRSCGISACTNVLMCRGALLD
jgi:hypothetical protein